ncbi:hypothetical protein [Pseudooceanicola aestuarii]|uniref:hypothetical protein n=1 Tax=Pseudooceanicola aestuarii TaxID=2697319 RepID=UPI0013D77F3A|nr:hypothetical protein [Pseudooceanicola aestuarii]
MTSDRITELNHEAASVTSLITDEAPGRRHRHLDRLHRLVSDYARTGTGVPAQLRRLQEDLTNEAMEARFDNLPV